MAAVGITASGVVLPLTTAKGAIRIADKNGNHFPKPTEAANIDTNAVEWMITNDEVNSLARTFLTTAERRETAKELKAIKDFIWATKWATREALKTTSKEIAEFTGFKIYEYTEKFYSFEKILKSGISLRITFKMGDYTLAPHLFVLLAFGLSSITLANHFGAIRKNGAMGKQACATWTPQKEDVKEIIKALAQASENHRNDIIKFLER